uniref:Uncharacterized protein n=1 Tax=Psilocybe cubensis TaxID=181762 RepID=A0A8H7XLG1_PSICU
MNSNMVPIYDSNGRIEGYCRIQQTNTTAARNYAQRNTPAAHSNILALPSTPAVPSGTLPLQPTNLPSVGVAVDWDGWPDGEFSQDFSFDEVAKTGNLLIHWAHKVNGGDRYGNDHANKWRKGKRSSRRCLGAIICDNQDCTIVIRPKTSPQSIIMQMKESCLCGSYLIRQTCNVVAYTWRWSGGVHFYNTGIHKHRRPGRILHALPVRATL